jgi:hypothetical protein
VAERRDLEGLPDLGRVEVIAEVELNGKAIGNVWKFPYRLDITEAARPGDNDLEIQVTNLWPNRLIGDEQFPAECEYGGGMAGPSGGGGFFRAERINRGTAMSVILCVSPPACAAHHDCVWMTRAPCEFLRSSAAQGARRAERRSTARPPGMPPQAPPRMTRRGPLGGVKGSSSGA